MKRTLLVLAVVVLVPSAREAAAQSFISPFAGTTLTSPSTSGTHSKTGYGIAFGSAGGFFGFDTEFAYFPEVLDNSANGLAKSRVLTFSGDTLIGPTIGRVKVYGAFGFGNMNVNFTSVSSLLVPNPESITKNYLTVNAGGGALIFLASSLGVRGDLRYFRAYGFNTADLEGSGVTLTHFDFWRATVGLAVKF